MSLKKIKQYVLMILLIVLIHLFIPISIPTKFNATNIESVTIYKERLGDKNSVKNPKTILDEKTCHLIFDEAKVKLKISGLAIGKSEKLYYYSEIKLLDGTFIRGGAFFTGSNIRFLDRNIMLILSEKGRLIMKSKLAYEVLKDS